MITSWFVALDHDNFITMYFISGMTMAQIRRSRSESHSDAYDANDDEDDLFIPRSSRNGRK